MVHPDGFSSHAAFRDAGRSVIDTRRLFYVGGSQGGILGGALTAVAPDHDRAVLAVPAMNYSLLLPRSIQFDPFRGFCSGAYPNELQRALILSMMRALGPGRRERLRLAPDARPYRNTPRHTVLQGLRRPPGDQRRDRGGGTAYLRTPALDPGRSLDRRPFYRIRRVPRYPWSRLAGCEAPGGARPAGTPAAAAEPAELLGQTCTG